MQYINIKCLIICQCNLSVTLTHPFRVGAGMHLGICWPRSRNISYMFRNVQVVLVLHDFVLCDFALTRLENLYHFLNLCNNF
jgi:hypothetical protein